MNWLQRLEPESAEYPANIGLPRRLLKHLVVAHNIGVGSRILDVGCGDGKLVRFLDQLGINAAGMDESSEAVAEATQTSPDLTFFSADPADGLPAETEPFDLILVRACAAYNENMFSQAAFRATAELLSIVRPAGYLVVVQPTASAADHIAGRVEIHAHNVACAAAHLSTFPGKCTSQRFPAGLHQPQRWRRMFGGATAGETFAATLQIPANRITREEWLRGARHAAASFRKPCCEPVGSASSRVSRAA